MSHKNLTTHKAHFTACIHVTHVLLWLFSKALSTLTSTVAEFGDSRAEFGNSLRFWQLLPMNSATVAVFGNSRRIRRQIVAVSLWCQE